MAGQASPSLEIPGNKYWGRGGRISIDIPYIYICIYIYIYIYIYIF